MLPAGSRQKVQFLSVVANSTNDNVSGYATHIPDKELSDKDPGAEEGRGWAFNIPLLPTKENLKKAAILLADILEGHHYKICLLNDPDRSTVDKIDWDSTAAKFNDESDRNHAGKELVVFMRYDPDKRVYEKEPWEWKVLMLIILQRLLDPKNGIILGSVSHSIGDRAVPVIAFYPSLISYSSFKPTMGRHGILHQTTFNPRRYEDPLERVSFTEDDFRLAGIDLDQLRKVQQLRISEQTRALNVCESFILHSLAEVSKIADTQKVTTIEMLDRLAEEIGKTATDDELKNLVKKNKDLLLTIADRFPRVPDKKLSYQQDISDLISYIKSLDVLPAPANFDVKAILDRLTKPDSAIKKQALQEIEDTTRDFHNDLAITKFLRDRGYRLDRLAWNIKTDTATFQLIYRRLKHIIHANNVILEEKFRLTGRVILDYLDSNWPSRALSEAQQNEAGKCRSDATRAEFIRDLIMRLVNTLDLRQRQKYISVIEEAFQYYNLADTVKKWRALHIKEYLRRHHYGNWKDAILDGKHEEQINLHFYTSNNTANATDNILTDLTRFTSVSKKGPGTESYAITGSTFVTNIPDNAPQRHTLDAAYSSIITNDVGNVVSNLIAIADGRHGHEDAMQDRAIGRLSHFAIKHAVRIMADYYDPDILLNEISQMVPQ